MIRSVPTADNLSHRIVNGIGFALLLALLAVPRAGLAQTCSFRDATYGAIPNIAFTTYAPGGPDVDSSGQFRFECSNASVRAEVLLSAGGSGSIAQRQMAIAGGGGARLNYNLYTDAARTVIWRDVASAEVGTLIDVRRRTFFTVYGRIAGGQWVDAGDYADTITITIVY